MGGDKSDNDTSQQDSARDQAVQQETVKDTMREQAQQDPEGFAEKWGTDK